MSATAWYEGGRRQGHGSPRRAAMRKRNSLASQVSRRTFIKKSAGAGAVLASTLAAPHVLAQGGAPIRIGNINSYTGGLAYAGENNLNGMNLYFDSINWTVAGRKIELIK